MIMPSRDRSPVVVLDHDLHEPTDVSPIIETFSLAITFRRDSGSNHTPKLMVRRGLTRSTLSRSDLVLWHISTDRVGFRHVGFRGIIGLGLDIPIPARMTHCDISRLSNSLARHAFQLC